jgi:hypothetical protein
MEIPVAQSLDGLGSIDAHCWISLGVVAEPSA